MDTGVSTTAAIPLTIRPVRLPYDMGVAVRAALVVTQVARHPEGLLSAGWVTWRRDRWRSLASLDQRKHVDADTDRDGRSLLSVCVYHAAERLGRCASVIRPVDVRQLALQVVWIWHGTRLAQFVEVRHDTTVEVSIN